MKNLDRATLGSCKIWIVKNLDCEKFGSCIIWIMQNLDKFASADFGKILAMTVILSRLLHCTDKIFWTIPTTEVPHLMLILGLGKNCVT